MTAFAAIDLFSRRSLCGCYWPLSKCDDSTGVDEADERKRNPPRGFLPSQNDFRLAPSNRDSGHRKKPDRGGHRSALGEQVELAFQLKLSSLNAVHAVFRFHGPG
jgi:hypothetical protein